MIVFFLLTSFSVFLQRAARTHRNVVGLAIGYSKAIVVDMGFCLQGNEENELPEVLMGCCSCYHVDMSTGTKL